MPQRRPSSEEDVLIIVKAVPRPSQRYGETVCCAGVTREQEWRRLYPIRFRQLKDRFSRWEWLRCHWRLPTSDRRPESRHVYEDSLQRRAMMPERERSGFLAPLLRESAREAFARGESLALVRPIESNFRWKTKPKKWIDEERRGYTLASRQTALFDKQLSTLEPCPFEFRLSFKDQDGWHHHSCSDWETYATYWKLSQKYGCETALSHLDAMFNDKYPKNGFVVALGTLAKRPNTWILLGIVRLDCTVQASLF